MLNVFFGIPVSQWWGAGGAFGTGLGNLHRLLISHPAPSHHRANRDLLLINSFDESPAEDDARV